MSEHALAALEFGRVLEIVAAHASSELGAEAVRGLRPRFDLESVAASLDDADEMLGWLVREQGWSPPPIPDLRSALRRLSITGSVWSESELVGALRLLKAARAVRGTFLPRSGEFGRLRLIAESLLKDEKLQARLQGALDEHEESLKDDASPELKRLRRSIRNARDELVRLLESLASRLPERIAVPNASVTIRGGRYCIPIRREGRSQVGGIVHDESASRATLFVEPPTAIEPMNLLRELELSERREVERLLRELTDAVRPRADELRDTLERLVEVDSLYARGRYALQRGCVRPTLVGWLGKGYRVVHGRHPLLLETADALVPFDLVLNPGEYTLLVTGPNAGGKTVLIKAIGLVSAMAQAGILPPVGPGSEIPVFRAILADIGDEQSIDASLSTFTAHLKNLTEILEGAEAGSLCLIDEIGGATDPVEGTALARAVLLDLAERRSMTVATSHLGGLNTLPGEHSGVLNAGLAFDSEQMEPLYKLVKGRPGRSYALAMARRVGFPRNVLEVAWSSLSEEELDTTRLLAELEEKEAAVEQRLEELERRSRTLADAEEALARRETELGERAQELERDAHRQAREFVLEARRKLDEALKADREAAREARRELESRLRTHSRALQALEVEPRRATGAETDLAPGDRVWIMSLEREGRVAELRGGEVVVELGGVKLQLDPEVLQRRDAPGDSRESVSAYAGGDADARSEVDLRGLVADEARMELMRALDSAVQAGLTQLRVIHGKGTGVLRDTVDDYARGDRRIKAHRLGASWEGGSGVTVLELE